MTKFKDQTLLVTGASGHFGRIAIEELLARGATKVIAGTRDPSKLADLAARGVEVRKVDFDDEAALPAAFAGVDRLLLISTDAIGARIKQQQAAVKAAVAASIKHIVYTSAPNARPNPNGGVSPEHYWTEQAIAASGLDFTILRNHLYTDLILYSAPQALQSGQSFDATGGRARTNVTRADTARTAAGALLQAEGQEIFDVTGPEALTAEALTAEIAKVGGKPVTRIGVNAEQLKQGMLSAGVPAGMVDVLVAFDNDAANGFHEPVTDVVERFSGRKPQSVATFLAENAAALRG